MHRDRRRRRTRHATAFHGASIHVARVRGRREASCRNEKGKRAPLPCMGMQFVSASARIWYRTFCVPSYVRHTTYGRPALSWWSVPFGTSAAYLPMRTYVCLYTGYVIWSIAGFLWETQVVCRVRWLWTLPLTLCARAALSLFISLFLIKQITRPVQIKILTVLSCYRLYLLLTYN